jgi:hypothetical protein
MKNLSVVFIDLEEASNTVENVSRDFFQVLREEDVNDVEHLNKIAADAYQANGWSVTKGRPAADATDKPAPDVVKQYLSYARRGFALKLDVKSFETMYKLKEAIAAPPVVVAANDAAKKEEHDRPTFAKSSTCVAIGALWEHLPPDVQTEFDNEVLKLLARFGKKMHGLLDAG